MPTFQKIKNKVQKQRAAKNESLFGTIYTLGTIDTFIIKKSIENNNLRFMQIVPTLLTFGTNIVTCLTRRALENSE